MGLTSSQPLNPEMSAKIAQRVSQIITENGVAVFSKSYCPYCIKAKDTLKALNQPFYALELDQIDDGSAIQNHLAELTGQRTVPNIFIKGKHIGGCSDLLDLKAKGELAKLLA